MPTQIATYLSKNISDDEFCFNRNAWDTLKKTCRPPGRLTIFFSIKQSLVVTCIGNCSVQGCGDRCSQRCIQSQSNTHDGVTLSIQYAKNSLFSLSSKYVGECLVKTRHESSVKSLLPYFWTTCLSILNSFRLEPPILRSGSDT